MKPFEDLLGDRYITADIESPLAKVKMDIHRIPFEDNSFDVLFCNHVLEHVDDDLLAMQEMLRVLKPGGWAIMQVPLEHERTTTYEDKSIVDPKQREIHFGQNDHQRVYGTDYGHRLQRAGFLLQEDQLAKELSPEEIQRYGIDSKEVLYVVSKPTDAAN
jgi:ubiquinone/menaquinone biosynthesis C-methylase UbiE